MSRKATNLRVLIWAAVSTRPQAQEDKSSLPVQEADGRAFAASIDGSVVDVLKVPGHSRNRRDLHELNQEMLSSGIDALDKLIRHWKDKSFDILWVRDSERFARKQSLLARIVEETIETAGARIFSHADGFIDQNNYLGWISITGYKTSSDVRRLVAGRHMGMKKRGERGLQTGKLPLLHRYTYDAKGEPAKTRGADGYEYFVTVDRDRYQRFLDDLYALFVEQHVSYLSLHIEMHDRGHYGGRKGYYYQLFFYDLVWSSTFWGHMRYAVGGSVQKKRWQIDPNYAHEKPDGLEIYYNVCEPAYIGAQATAFRAEMYRRQQFQGGAPQKERYRFSGLVRCNQCGAALVGRNSGHVSGKYYQCNNYFRRKRDLSSSLPECDQKTFLRGETIQEFFDTVLFPALLAPERAAFVASLYAKPTVPKADYARELAALQARIDTLQANMSDPRFPDAAREDAYRNLETLYGDRTRLLKLAQTDQHDRHAADDHLAALDSLDLARRLPGLWNEPNPAINQYLYRLLHGLRLYARDGQIVGLGQQRG